MEAWWFQRGMWDTHHFEQYPFGENRQKWGIPLHGSHQRQWSKQMWGIIDKQAVHPHSSPLCPRLSRHKQKVFTALTLSYSTYSLYILQPPFWGWADINCMQFIYKFSIFTLDFCCCCLSLKFCHLTVVKHSIGSHREANDIYWSPYFSKLSNSVQDFWPHAQWTVCAHKNVSAH